MSSCSSYNFVYTIFTYKDRSHKYFTFDNNTINFSNKGTVLILEAPLHKGEKNQLTGLEPFSDMCWIQYLIFLESLIE